MSNRRHVDLVIDVESYSFESLEDFVYLGTITKTDNNFNLDIQRRITLVNKSYLGLSRQMSSALCDAEEPTKTTPDKAVLKIFANTVDQVFPNFFHRDTFVVLNKFRGTPTLKMV